MLSGETTFEVVRTRTPSPLETEDDVDRYLHLAYSIRGCWIAFDHKTRGASLLPDDNVERIAMGLIVDSDFLRKQARGAISSRNRSRKSLVHVYLAPLRLCVYSAIAYVSHVGLQANLRVQNGGRVRRSRLIAEVSTLRSPT